MSFNFYIAYEILTIFIPRTLYLVGSCGSAPDESFWKGSLQNLPLLSHSEEMCVCVVGCGMGTEEGLCDLKMFKCIILIAANHSYQ